MKKIQNEPGLKHLKINSFVPAQLRHSGGLV